MTFFPVTAAEYVVNVASVPKRSPFRYPGGKTWLVPHIRQWLTSIKPRPTLLVEPFAGGAIVSLTAAFEGLVDHIVLSELDDDVSSVWRTIFEGNAEALVERILTFDLTHDNVRATLARQDGDISEQAFRTILRNRTQHGGIMAAGASLIKHGENGKGLRSRWYVDTLAKRIRAIAAIRDRFTFVAGDGIELMRQYSRRKRAAFFIDPPYTAGGTNGKRAGTRLYTHYELDHELLFEKADRVAGDILLTYDDAPDVRELAAKHSLEVEQVAMKNTHHAKMTELLIGRNMQWIR
ncbi:MAG: DNA adenine methylase [Phycisphaeraceae bacterium]|nr:DNA adenine methylase [Phycisphaeraceae bacterium]